MSDPFSSQTSGLTTPLTTGFAMTPSDAADLPRVTRQIRVTGASGVAAVIWASGDQSIEPVTAGDILDWRIRRLLETGTTATGLRGYA